MVARGAQRQAAQTSVEHLEAIALPRTAYSQLAIARRRHYKAVGQVARERKKSFTYHQSSYILFLLRRLQTINPRQQPDRGHGAGPYWHHAYSWRLLEQSHCAPSSCVPLQCQATVEVVGPGGSYAHKSADAARKEPSTLDLPNLDHQGRARALLFAMLICGQNAFESQMFEAYSECSKLCGKACRSRCQ